MNSPGGIFPLSQFTGCAKINFKGVLGGLQQENLLIIRRANGRIYPNKS
jgi:hypothetical protein